ncbi:hypothetical protein M885DRAFT_523061, partial [Pelagophyceae sp. CCMP2097]
MYASKGFDASDATKQPIGEEQGSCITVAGGNASVEYECSWTNSFDNQGSITVQGKWLYNVSNSNDQFEYGILAITGGTGSYIGAAGEVRVNCPEESEPSLAFCTYDFGWRSLFQSSDGEVDESPEDNENNNNEVEVTPTAAQADAAETDANAVATSAENTASTVAGSAESTTGTAADAAEADTSAVAAGAENTASTAAGSAENTANNAAAAAMGNPAPAVPGVPGVPG